jgi:antitoxin FitA
MLAVRRGDGRADPCTANGIRKVVDAASDHRGPGVSDAFVDQFVDQREFVVRESRRHWRCHTHQYTYRRTAKRSRRTPGVLAPGVHAGAEVLVCAGSVCMYYACVPNIQVRDVPEEIHGALVRRAELAGQSLQQFLAAQLAAIAAAPTLDEMLDRIENRPKGRLSRRDAVAALDAERARR